MFQYYCLNPIAQVGLDGFGADYKKTEDIKEADGVLVRSAAMHDMELPEKLLAVARAGAGVNNIPLDKCAEKGIVSPLSAQYSPTATASCSRLMAIKTIRPSAPYLSYICCTSGNSQRQSPHAVLKNNMNEGCPCKLPLSTVRPSFITTVNSGNMSPTSTASGCMPASSFSLTQEETRDRNPIIK